MSDLSPAQRRALAFDRVSRGRAIVARQRRLIADIRAHHGSAADAEHLLARFEQTLAIFEDDLRRIEADDANA